MLRLFFADEDVIDGRTAGDIEIDELVKGTHIRLRMLLWLEYVNSMAAEQRTKYLNNYQLTAEAGDAIKQQWNAVFENTDDTVLEKAYREVKNFVLPVLDETAAS